MNIGDRLFKQTAEVAALIGNNRHLFSEPAGHHLDLAQNHLRVLDKVAVHLDTVFVSVQMHPIRFEVNQPVSLLQNKDV